MIYPIVVSTIAVGSIAVIIDLRCPYFFEDVHTMGGTLPAPTLIVNEDQRISFRYRGNDSRDSHVAAIVAFKQIRKMKGTGNH